MNPINRTAPATNAGRKTLLLCLLVACCEGFDLQAAGVAAAGITAQFKPAPETMGTFFAASTLGLFLGALLGGRLADSIGRRVVLIYSIVAFGLFSLLTAFAWNLESLTAARFFTGLGLGGALPMVMTMVSEASAPERRPTHTALAFAGMPTGGAIASAVALLAGPARWPALFVIGGVLPLLLALALWRGLQESAEFTALKTTIQSAPEKQPQTSSFLKTLAKERAWQTVLLWISFFLALLILYLLLNWLPTLLKDKGMSGKEAALAQIIFNVGGALAALGMGRLLAGRWRLPSLLAVFLAVPVLLFALSQIGSDFPIAGGVVFLLGVAVLALQAFLYATAPATYPTWLRGAGVGAAIAIGRLGSIVGPKLGGSLKAMGSNPSQLLLDLLPIAIVGSIASLVLALRAPSAPSPDTGGDAPS